VVPDAALYTLVNTDAAHQHSQIADGFAYLAADGLVLTGI
jgi:hypothetical protein